jgi:hypothetical protein
MKMLARHNKFPSHTAIAPSLADKSLSQKRLQHPAGVVIICSHLNKTVQIARRKILNDQSYHRRWIGRAGSGNRDMIDDDDKEFRRDMRGLHELLFFVIAFGVVTVVFAIVASWVIT